MKSLAEKLRHKKEESELSSGMLYATGLVAGGSLGGVLIAVVTASGDIPLVKRLLTSMGIQKPLIDALDFGARFYGDFRESLVSGGLLCAVVFGLLCFLLVRNARKDLEA
jgi:hypothetical protein